VTEQILLEKELKNDVTVSYTDISHEHDLSIITFPGSVESLPVSDSAQDRIVQPQESADSLISPDAWSSDNDPASYLSIENPSPDDKRRFVLLGPPQPREQGRPLILEKYE